jgi:hypothetical protein
LIEDASQPVGKEEKKSICFKETKAPINVFILLHPLHHAIKCEVPFPVLIFLRSATLWDWQVLQTRPVASVSEEFLSKK